MGFLRETRRERIERELATAEVERLAEVAAMDAAGCYAAGYERGYSDGLDGYSGGTDVGYAYPYPSEARDGYRDGWNSGDKIREEREDDDRRV